MESLARPTGKRNKHLKLLGIILLVLFLITLASLVALYPPRLIVETLGMRNAYLITFVVSLFGGFSAAGSVSFISLLAILVAGGAHPLGLALVAGTSLAIGDIFMFYLGGKGREMLTGKWKARVERLAQWFEQHRFWKRLTPFLAYLYVGFAPIPNDILIMFLAAIKYPRRLTYKIIAAGDLTFALVVVILAEQSLVR
jgi:membrane protein YqaA with SNARE-associated domain